MKKTKTFGLIVLAMLTVFVLTTGCDDGALEEIINSFVGGTGEPNTDWYDDGESPFTINNADDLAGLARLVNEGIDDFYEKTVNLGSNIDLSVYGADNQDFNDGKGWISIGHIAWHGEKDGYPFRGTFDGKDKNIINLYMDSSADPAGLFGFVHSGVVKNLTLVNVNITGGNPSGAVVAFLDDSEINKCNSQGEVTGLIRTGGIVGHVQSESKIISCQSYGTVHCFEDPDYSFASGGGGIAGVVSASEVTSCTSYCNVSGGTKLGGLVGYVLYHSEINYCSAISGVTASGDYAGGLVGHIEESTIDYGISDGSVSGNDYVGGLIGYGYNIGWLENSYSRCGVDGHTDVGGLAGRLSANPGLNYINNCYATGSVSGYSRIGGLVGWVEYASITNCYAKGRASGGVLDVGGIAGVLHSTEIRHCFSTGSVSGDSVIGGIAGAVSVRPSGPPSVIYDCYSTGNITGVYMHIGGIAGAAVGLGEVIRINRCYATGDIGGSQDHTVTAAGGIVGSFVDDTNTSNLIHQCVALNPGIYYADSLSIGRVIGNFSGDNKIIGYNLAYSGMIPTAAFTSNPLNNGTSISKAQAKTQATYTDLDWTFGSSVTWKWGNSSSYNLPVQSWQDTSTYPYMPWQLQD